jgi:hypothetical protein
MMGSSSADIVREGPAQTFFWKEERLALPLDAFRVCVGGLRFSI